LHAHPGGSITHPRLNPEKPQDGSAVPPREQPTQHTGRTLSTLKAITLLDLLLIVPFHLPIASHRKQRCIQARTIYPQTSGLLCSSACPWAWDPPQKPTVKRHNLSSWLAPGTHESGLSVDQRLTPRQACMRQVFSRRIRRPRIHPHLQGLRPTACPIPPRPTHLAAGLCRDPSPP
ncbi:hypothetical protein FSOLCH5_005960, partial [Fusarium solani]